MRDDIVTLARECNCQHSIKYFLPTVLRYPRLNELRIRRIGEKGL